MFTPISNTAANASAANGQNGFGATNAADMQNQFLTLLVAQLKNQDPTAPMDNAQMTSQMAQISTVTGIEKLNDTVNSVTSQFSTVQMLQGSKKRHDRLRLVIQAVNQIRWRCGFGCVSRLGCVCVLWGRHDSDMR